jgi:hypothetical protein
MSDGAMPDEAPAALATAADGGNPTGSSLERAYHCAAGFALPRGGRTTEASAHGTSNHEGIVRAIRSGLLTAVPECVRTLAEGAERIELEVAYAIDAAARTARCIGHDVGRAYGALGRDEIALTVDAVFYYRDGSICVADWKSRKRVTFAQENWQIRTGCLAVLTISGEPAVDGALGYLDNGELDPATFDVFDAETLWGELAAMLRRVREARATLAAGLALDVHAGPWCEYCPAMAYCSEHTRLARAMLGELEQLDEGVTALTADALGRAWEKTQRIAAILDRIQEGIKARAKHEVIPLPNGKRLALIDSHRTSLDQQAAKLLLAEHGLPVPMKRTEFPKIAEVSMAPPKRTRRKPTEENEP